MRRPGPRLAFSGQGNSAHKLPERTYRPGSARTTPCWPAEDVPESDARRQLHRVPAHTQARAAYLAASNAAEADTGLDTGERAYLPAVSSPVDPARWWPQVTSGGGTGWRCHRRDVELAENSEDVIDWRLVHQTGSCPAKDATRIAGRRGSGRGGTGCFAALGLQGVGQPFEVRHGHGERRVATSAKR